MFNKISRRTFIQKSATVGAFLFASFPFSRFLRSHQQEYGPRIGLSNPYVASNGKPILICVSGTDIKEMFGTGLEAIGGLGKLIFNNSDVLIKPNLNSQDVYPAISSVEGIVGLIEAVKGVTDGNVSVGDQSYDPTNMVYRHINLESAVSSAGASLLNFSSTYPVRRDTWDSNKPDFSVYSAVYDSPVIISFCCIKRHFLAKMSCALKNNVGNITGSGTTGSRAYLHDLSGKQFLQEVAEIAGLINPELTIVDARSMLTVSGPFSEWGVIKTGINKLIICGDMVATDAYCAKLLAENDDSFNISSFSETLTRAESLGLGTSDLEQVEIIEVESTTDSMDESSIPANFKLYQNHPNPFNPITTINYDLPEQSHVVINIYDILGRKIRKIVNSTQDAGYKSVIWDGTDEFGRSVGTGIYLYQIRAGDFTQTRKMLLLQ